jgi:hypothetical protein
MEKSFRVSARLADFNICDFSFLTNYIIIHLLFIAKGAKIKNSQKVIVFFEDYDIYGYE